MAEYIEREVAVCIALGAVQLGNTAFSDRFEIAARIRKIPAADVQPVVLCRDCIFRSNEWTGCSKLNGTITGNEFYCKCGIKREEN